MATKLRLETCQDESSSPCTSERRLRKRQRQRQRQRRRSCRSTLLHIIKLPQFTVTITLTATLVVAERNNTQPSPRSLSSVSTEEFVARVDNIFRHDHTVDEKGVGSPSAAPPCTFDTTGFFGFVGDGVDNVTVRYEVEIEALSGTGSDMKSDIVPAVESALGDAVMEGLFPEKCSASAAVSPRTRGGSGSGDSTGGGSSGGSRERARRELVVYTSFMDEEKRRIDRRRLQMLGIGNAPADVVIETKECLVEKIDPSDRCGYVSGGITVFFVNETVTELIKVVYGYMEYLIEQVQDYPKIHPDIVRITFYRMNLQDIEGPPDVNARSIEGDDSDDSEKIGGLGIVLIVIGVVGALILASILIRRRRKVLGENEEESFMLGNSGDGQDTSLAGGMGQSSDIGQFPDTEVADIRGTSAFML